MINRRAVAGLTLSAVALVSLLLSEDYVGKAAPPVPGDVCTLGFGTTDGVKCGDTTTPPKAVARALTDVQKFEGALKQCVAVPLSQNEYDAYTQLAYNVGAARFCNSTIPVKLAAYDYPAACKTILDFNKFRDCTKPKVLNKKTGKYECPLVELRGLTLRRGREYQLCIKP